MKVLLTILAVLIISAVGTPPPPAPAAAQNSSEDWTEAVVAVIRDCKKTGCTKEQTYEKLRKLIDDIMKEVKPGSLKHEECDEDIADIVNMLGKDDVITGSEFIEFIKGLGPKYEDKFEKKAAAEAPKKP